MNSENYSSIVKEKMPKSNHGKNMLWAFFVGGTICTIGEGVNVFATDFLMQTTSNASSIQAIVMVFIGASLTGLGVYDKIGKRAGAGSIVPITGFANSICAPAMDFRREGIIMGVGTKMFSLAGPVLVNGISISVIIGIVHYIIGIVS